MATNPVLINEGITTSGEVARETDFEETEEFWAVKNGKFVKDTVLDDQALIMNLDDGLVVVTGCAHSGIVNTIKHAQRITSKHMIRAIIGGFHLSKASSEVIRKTVEEMMVLDPQLVFPCHCTGIKAISKLIEAFGDRCKPLHTGSFIEI
jgi:7,8-dihydropterin-6-yl-methyl-4-(beta-D-ribofuranosyl)aminobenzene 5'-phosphate synthase